MDTPLGKSPIAQSLQLDLDRDVSSLLDGRGQMQHGSSGLTHEQEVVLSYFSQAQTTTEATQISRYEELDTCKAVAALLEAGLLVPLTGRAPTQASLRAKASAQDQPLKDWDPSPLLWPLVALAFIVPLVLYVPHHRGSMNMGLASLQPVDVRVVPEGPTRLRQAWALRMASPQDGGTALAMALGRPLDGKNPVPDMMRLPDPMMPQARQAPESAATPKKK